MLPEGVLGIGCELEEPSQLFSGFCHKADALEAGGMWAEPLYREMPMSSKQQAVEPVPDAKER